MKVGIFTSGGDSCGMNAAVRAAVRMGIRRGVRMYAILDGFQGMVHNDIHEIFWSDVGGILSRGGTIIGTARSMEFMALEGQSINARACVW
jgi:6-phosphofructokinase 1